MDSFVPVGYPEANPELWARIVECSAAARWVELNPCGPPWAWSDLFKTNI